VKTLSIRHPGVDLILAGGTVGVRSWPTDHGGQILLHAGATVGHRERAADVWLRRVHGLDSSRRRLLRSIVAVAEIAKLRGVGAGGLSAAFVRHESIAPQRADGKDRGVARAKSRLWTPPFGSKSCR